MRHPKHRHNKRQSGRSWRDYGDDEMEDEEDLVDEVPPAEEPTPTVAAQPTKDAGERVPHRVEATKAESEGSGSRTSRLVPLAVVVAVLVVLWLLFV